jgi:hypothetical protein
MSKSQRDFVYLACPYSAPDPYTKEDRFISVTKAASHLMSCGFIVYSPITHCHPMEVHGGLPQGWKFWKRIDEVYIKHCHTVFILPLEGWESSVGVNAEIIMANKMGIPILFLNPVNYDIDWEKEIPISIDDNSTKQISVTRGIIEGSNSWYTEEIKRLTLALKERDETCAKYVKLLAEK